MIELLRFVYSFAVYSLFRALDVDSTERVSKKLNFEMHEVNSLLVWMTKKNRVQAGQMDTMDRNCATHSNG